MMRSILILALICISNILLNGQIALLTGSLDFLRDSKQNIVKIEFYYKNLKIKGLTENEYIENYTKKKNDDNPRSGDIWSQSWHDYKIKNWEPYFTSFFNNAFEDSSIYLTTNLIDAKYVMTVSLTDLYPGFFIGYTQEPASLSAFIAFKETANPDKIIAVIKIKNITPGNYLSINEMERISDCYGLLAEKSGKYISKTIYKKH